MIRLQQASALASVLTLFLTGGALAQEKLTKEKLVGAWTLISIQNDMPDGSKVDPMAGKGTGILTFEPNGKFSWLLLRSDTPKYASNNRLKGTPQEYKGTAVGTLAYFGSYKLDPDGKTMSMHIDQSSFGNFRGGDQKRSIKFKGDELTLSNPAGASGGTANVTWKKGG